MSLEETLIKKIEAAIRGIKMKTKQPKDVASDVANSLARLKTVNEGMATDLIEKYKNVIEDWKRTHPSN